MIFRNNRIPSIEGLAHYIQEISDRYCSYLRSAHSACMNLYSVYVLPDESFSELQETVFLLGLLHTECLRNQRAIVEVEKKLLLCENLIFRFQSEDIVDGRMLLSWPHWLLKCRYTDAGVMFGKFWKGETENARNGEPLPIPPIHFLSIRSAIKTRDPQFFRKARQLTELMLSSKDTGQDVFDDLHLPWEIRRIIKIDITSLSAEDTLDIALTLKKESSIYRDLLSAEKSRWK